MALVGEDVNVQSLERQRLCRATVFARGVVVAHLAALQVAKHGPFLVKALVGVVVLKHVLWMGMRLEEVA